MHMGDSALAQGGTSSKVRRNFPSQRRALQDLLGLDNRCHRQIIGVDFLLTCTSLRYSPSQARPTCACTSHKGGNATNRRLMRECIPLPAFGIIYMVSRPSENQYLRSLHAALTACWPRGKSIQSLVWTPHCHRQLGLPIAIGTTRAHEFWSDPESFYGHDTWKTHIRHMKAW